MTNDEIIAKFYEAVQSGDYQSFLDTVLHTQYIGARYVPIFADPLQWSSATAYEPLTIVTNQGNSYTSRQYVPTGIDIANTDYWALTGNYNAQIEQYRQEVQQYIDQVSTYSAQIEMLTDRSEFMPLRAYIIGNSYTSGYDDESRANSIGGSGVCDRLFINWRARGSSSAGIVPYDTKHVSFNNILENMIKEFPDEKDSITDLIFNIAVGDSNALAIQGDTTYQSNLRTRLTELQNTINTYLPNIKRVRFVYLDALYNNSGRVVSGTTITIGTMAALNRYLRLIINEYENFSYMGWATVSLFGSSYMNNSDNLHPTVVGYYQLTSYWVDTILGNNHSNDVAQVIYNNIDISELITNATATIYERINQNYILYTIALSFNNSTVATTNAYVDLPNSNTFFHNLSNANYSYTIPLGKNFTPIPIQLTNNPSNRNIRMRVLGNELSNTLSSNYDQRFSIFYPF